MALAVLIPYLTINRTQDRNHAKYKSHHDTSTGTYPTSSLALHLCIVKGKGSDGR